MRKSRGRLYVNKSVSFPPDLLDAARKKSEALRLSLSAYVQRCVESDLARKGPMLLDERPELREAVAQAAEKALGAVHKAAPDSPG